MNVVKDTDEKASPAPVAANPSRVKQFTPSTPCEPEPPERPSVRREFPIDALPPIMREMAEHGAVASNTPITMTAPLVLAASSLALGAGIELDCGGSLRCRGNLHILGIAESGTGKSEAAKVILRPIHEEHEETTELWERDERPRLKAEVAILKDEERKAQKDGDPSVLAKLIGKRERAELLASEKGRPVLFVATATREALAAMLSLGPNQAGAIINTDARGHLGIVAGKYSAGKASDEDIYLAGYSGDGMSSMRVGSGHISLECPCLVTCLLIQPDVFDMLRQNDIFASSGWLQRNLVFDSKASFGPLPEITPDVPENVMDAWSRHLRGCLANIRSADGTHTVRPSAGARRFMRVKQNAVRARIQDGELKDVATFACRWAEQANRIALNLHATLYPDAQLAAANELSLETIQAAWRIAEWFADEQLLLLRGMREERRYARCAKLVEILNRSDKERQMPRWKLKDHGFEEDELIKLAAEFPGKIQCGETSSSSGRGGRHSKWVRAI